MTVNTEDEDRSSSLHLSLWLPTNQPALDPSKVECKSHPDCQFLFSNANGTAPISMKSHVRSAAHNIGTAIEKPNQADKWFKQAYRQGGVLFCGRVCACGATIPVPIIVTIATENDVHHVSNCANCGYPTTPIDLRGLPDGTGIKVSDPIAESRKRQQSPQVDAVKPPPMSVPAASSDNNSR